jgi:hypothetical protein
MSMSQASKVAVETTRMENESFRFGVGVGLQDMLA